MKIMSRNFTRSEKILLLLLAVILLGLFYYKAVDQNVRNSIASSEAEAQSLQTELTVVQARVQNLEKMQKEVDEVMGAEGTSRMESYNNSKAEVAFLNDILSEAGDYSIAFSEVTRNGDQIRRAFTLSYKTANYRAAEDIMEKLCSGEYRCLIGDVNCSIAEDGVTTAKMMATFYETMVGGVPDAGLPEDSAKTKNVTE